MAGQQRMTAEEFRQMPRQPKAPVQGPRAPNSQYALGRLPPGVMNKTEERFLREVVEPMMRSGQLLWWAFEGIKLRLAPKTFLTPDFAVMREGGLIELHDVKGAEHLIEEDALVKLKVAADRFPFEFFLTWPTKNRLTWAHRRIGR